jgi:hypothetical protein
MWKLELNQKWLVRKIYASLVQRKNALFFNGIFKFYNQNYMVMSVIGWIGVKDLRFSSPGEALSALISLCLVVSSCLYPCFIFYVYKFVFKKLDFSNATKLEK